MKSFAMFARTLFLSLLLAGPALAGETVDINTADAATLDRVLVNVGAAKAQAIVEYREANGPFRSAEELAMVSGIGLKTIEKNRERIVVGEAPAPAAPAAARTGSRAATAR